MNNCYDLLSYAVPFIMFSLQANLIVKVSLHINYNMLRKEGWNVLRFQIVQTELSQIGVNSISSICLIHLKNVKHLNLSYNWKSSNPGEMIALSLQAESWTCCRTYCSFFLSLPLYFHCLPWAAFITFLWKCDNSMKRVDILFIK